MDAAAPAAELMHLPFAAFAMTGETPGTGQQHLKA